MYYKLTAFVNTYFKKFYNNVDSVKFYLTFLKYLCIINIGNGASYIISENPNMDYFTPRQGTNNWYDAMVITRDCNETELAHQFINFMLNEESALSNTEEVGYTSPVKSVYETMITGEYEGVSSYIPDFENPNSEIFRYQEPKIKQKYAELWTKIKAE